MTTKSVVGLKNIGNTCFMNSALQLILHCDKFVNSVMKWKKKGKTIKVFQKLITEYHEEGTVTGKTLNQIKDTVGIFRSSFSGNFSQQDAHEFLDALLQAIEDEFKEGKDPKRMSNILDIHTQTDVVSRETDKKSHTKRTMTLVPLDLPVNPKLSTELARCFAYFTSPQPVDGKYKFEVKVDGETKEFPESVTKKLSITKCNDYILIQLKRFGQPFRGRFIKKSNNIYIPMMLENTNDPYMLKSFVVQRGDRGGGHYICYVRTGNDWYLANDSSVSKVDDDVIRKHALQAYLICYERVKPVKLN